jgi:biopolymer transport protein ExbD
MAGSPGSEQDPSENPVAIVVRQLGTRRLADDAELGAMLRGARADRERIGLTAIPVTIDVDGPVPWGEVVDVMNLCKRERIDTIEFAYGSGAPPARALH